MPPTDLPVVAALRQPDRYLITPAPADDASGVQHWHDCLQRAVAAGQQRIQLRLPPEHPQRQAMIEQAVRAHRRGVQWLINRDVALARALGVGVHLGSEQLQDLQERPLPEGQLVAASCHDLEQLQAAQRLGCDFVVLGPVQATASHPGAVPLGWEAFASCARRCRCRSTRWVGWSPAISPKPVATVGRVSLRLAGCGRREPSRSQCDPETPVLTPQPQHRRSARHAAGQGLFQAQADRMPHYRRLRVGYLRRRALILILRLRQRLRGIHRYHVYQYRRASDSS